MRYLMSVAVGALALVGVSHGSVLAQTGPVQVKPTPGLEFEARATYIFRFRDDMRASEVRANAAAAVAEANGSLRHVYTATIKGFSARMSDVAVARLLERNPNIVSVERDAVATIDKGPPPGKGKKKDSGDGGSSSQQTPWGITRVGGPAAATDGTAWVIDTGIDRRHEDLNVVGGANFVTFGKNSWDDGHGHGTHVAGTIAAKDNNFGVIGVCPGAKVSAVRVLDNGGSGLYSWVIAGVDYVAANGKAGDVANMSLSGPYSQALNDAVVLAAEKILFSLAAGNLSIDANSRSPASANGANIYTVSALDSGDGFAYFSNYGSSVDYAAPGVNVLSTYKGGGYATMSGTSMAAPHVAGILLASEGLSTCSNATGDPDGNPDPIAQLGVCSASAPSS